MSTSRLLIIGVCTAALSLSAYSLTQHPQAAKVIEDRQSNLEQIGDAFKTIRDQLRGNRDMAAISTAAETINALAPELPNWFPAGSGPEAGVETEALPAIWEDPDGFKSAADKLAREAGNMLAAATSGDLGRVGGQVFNLGGACKGCHDKFRLDDN